MALVAMVELANTKQGAGSLNTEVAEIWRPVPIADFSHLYEVSNTGRVRSLDRANQDMIGSGIRMKWSRRFKGRELRCKPNTRGYPCAYLRIAPIFRNVSVHRLVALAFVPNPDNLPEVNHVDTIKTNNLWTNLEWVTRLGNHTHAVDAGIMPHFNRKLSDEDIAAIRARAANREILSDIAYSFGINPGTVSKIVSGKRRAH